MKIRALRADDRAGWQPLWEGYQGYYKVDLSASTENTWERLLASNEDGPFGLVCEDEGGQLIGFTTFLYHGHTWQPEPRCYLVDLFTAPDTRGKGVGRRLIEAVDEAAKAHGCSQTYWLTQEFNEAGRRLYDKVATLTPFIKYQR